MYVTYDKLVEYPSPPQKKTKKRNEKFQHTVSAFTVKNWKLRRTSITGLSLNKDAKLAAVSIVGCGAFLFSILTLNLYRVRV